MKGLAHTFIFGVVQPPVSRPPQTGDTERRLVRLALSRPRPHLPQTPSGPTRLVERPVQEVKGGLPAFPVTELGGRVLHHWSYQEGGTYNHTHVCENTSCMTLEAYTRDFSEPGLKFKVEKIRNDALESVH